MKINKLDGHPCCEGNIYNIIYDNHILMKDRKICVVGLGYIGLPTAVVMANSGLDVYGMDIDPVRVERIRKADVDIREDGLVDALQSALKGGLRVGTEIEARDVYIVAVNTSLNPETLGVEMGPMKAACRTIGSVLKRGDLVIIESTLAPGTTEGVLKPILEDVSGLECPSDFHLAFCPERVLPGNLMQELVNNERIIGGIDQDSTAMAKELYSCFVKGKLHETDVLTAELAKLMENTYRTVNIALANELALITERVGGDVWKAIKMANHHPRVNIHLPGPGVGGYCLTKDPWFLISQYGDSKIIKDAMEINAAMPAHVVDLVAQALKGIDRGLNGAKVAVLGVAYKANVSDPRESPGYEIYRILTEGGAEVRLHDPYVEEYMGHRPLRSIKDAVYGCDAVVVATDHRPYRNMDWNEVVGWMAPNPVILDTKNIVNGSIEGAVVVKIGVGWYGDSGPKGD